MEIIPGRPDRNAARMLDWIAAARARGAALIVFPEMALPGYFLSDEWENDAFLDDVIGYHDELRMAAKNIAVIFGSVDVDASVRGEDGRRRRYNAAFVAQDGEWASGGVAPGRTYKTLLPNYREFDDARYFFSLRQLAMERGVAVESLLRPFALRVGGEQQSVGVLLCEDMWHEDYAVQPAQILRAHGAQLLINLSTSPWTFRKPDKRERVARAAIAKIGVPLLWCNAVGVQNTGKNLFILDGRSTAYDAAGNVVVCGAPNVEETISVNLTSLHCSPARRETRDARPENDIATLHAALVYGIRKTFAHFSAQRAVIGLSGGIDSAVSACLLCEALGAEHIFAVNLPTHFNADVTREAARILAENLRCHYSVWPIQASVDRTLQELAACRFARGGVESNAADQPCINALVHENVQARDRGSRVLAALAGSLDALLINNGNKTEFAFGYCTLYGDVNGALAPLGDCTKGQIYDLARYINNQPLTPASPQGGEKHSVGPIPTAILHLPPSAELSAAHDVLQGLGDPLCYPYHDALARAFVEWRCAPAHIAQWYDAGMLAEKFCVAPALLQKIFPRRADFFADLESKWCAFKTSAFKRLQAPPIVVVSRRAFGFDLRESQNGAHWTSRVARLA